MPAPPPQNQGASAAGQDVRQDDDALRQPALEAEEYAADQRDDPLGVGLEWVSDKMLKLTYITGSHWHVFTWI